VTRSVVLASRNAKKLAELQALLAPLGWQLRNVSEFGAESVEETAPTFVENALLKARQAARISGLPAIADDSGLEVDALGGAPGVRSARYAAADDGDNADDAANNRKLLDALRDVPDAQRSAQFVAVIVFLRHPDDPTPLIAQGRWRGRIARAPRGAAGFGYDPLFWIDERGCTAAELAPETKAQLSHRGRALAALRAALQSETAVPDPAASGTPPPSRATS
jgi:XTP/dITP diphosphohydrolase